VLAEGLCRAWAAGAGPGDDRLVVDVDSFVGEVYGYDKQGAGYGYTHKRGYHPIVATRGQTGEVLHIRARKGSANTSRGALRFVEELIPRVARAGASGPKLLRADSGFWNHKIMARLQAAGWTYSIGVRQQPHIKAAITAIPEQDWQILPDYPETGEAQIAQTMLGRQRRSCAAHGWSAPKPSCGPTGAITRSSLIALTRWSWSRQITASTPSWSSLSATSKTRHSRTSRRASSWPTPHGP
jgi:Transposase DDE domain group 1